MRLDCGWQMIQTWAQGPVDCQPAAVQIALHSTHNRSTQPQAEVASFLAIARQRSLHFWQSHVYGGQSAYGYSTVTNTVTTPQRGASNLDVTGRGSVESSCSAHRTHQHTLAGPTNTPSHQHTLEGDQQGHRMAAHNHFHQVRGAQMRVQCIPGEQTREPPHDGRAGTREWQH